MVTLKEIGNAAGVSPSTVSAVIRNKDYCYVSKAKRKLILETAEGLGYLPNMNSRALKGLPTNTVGLVASVLSVPINSHLINHLCNVVEGNGLFLLLGDSHSSPIREKSLVNEFLSRGIDGLLLDSSLPSEELDELIKGRIPYVGFNQMTGGTGGLSVTMSREAGACMAVEHLIANHRHDRIGFVVCGKKFNQEKKFFISRFQKPPR